ncbi:MULTISPECIES: sialate O-acetylesterase [unclassified Sphingomonas]|uniref:sialate O-acetylesterase n=1 Tax=unclassified Sphingomonas TaxID=196159 RepID=UPI0025EFCA5F|nr:MULTISPECIES: sialate O-acetylesterase [unclassified Sphingomonas]
MRAAAVAAVALALPLSVAASSPGTGPYDVYVLAGQSNMSGRGALAELTAAERVGDPRIRLYGNDGRWRVALDPLDDAAGQVDPVSADRQAAVGPGLPFARAMLRSRGRPIVLVPCAKGGSAITEWTPAPASGTLYGGCIRRIREAGGHLAGLLWYQGESDARTSVGAAWGERFATLVAAFRSDLGTPTLPVAFVQLADTPVADGARYPNWAVVQAQQAQVALPCVAMVPAARLARNPDELHLATAAQRTLGRRLARAMTRLIRRGC